MVSPADVDHSSAGSFAAPVAQIADADYASDDGEIADSGGDDVTMDFEAEARVAGAGTMATLETAPSMPFEPMFATATGAQPNASMDIHEL